MTDIMKLPGKWREDWLDVNGASCADELEAAMPVGTIITKDESTHPTVGKRIFHRFHKNADLECSTFRHGDKNYIELWLGVMWWPIPEGMFEPPEDK